MTLEQAIYEICTCFPKEIAHLITEYDAPTVPHEVGPFCQVLSDGRVLSAWYYHVDVFNPDMTKIIYKLQLHHLVYACEISKTPMRLLCNCDGEILILNVDTGKYRILSNLGQHNGKIVQLDNKDLFVISGFRDPKLIIYNIKTKTYTICPAEYDQFEKKISLHDDQKYDFTTPEWRNVVECLTKPATESLGEHKIIAKDNGYLRDGKQIQTTKCGFKILDKNGIVLFDQKKQRQIKFIVELDNSQLFCYSDYITIWMKNKRLFDYPCKSALYTLTTFPSRKILTRRRDGINVLWL